MRVILDISKMRVFLDISKMRVILDMPENYHFWRNEKNDNFRYLNFLQKIPPKN